MGVLKIQLLVLLVCGLFTSNLYAESNDPDVATALANKDFDALQKVPGVVITKEIIKHRELKKSLTAQLSLLSKTNLALCNALYGETVQTQPLCIGRTPLIPNQNQNSCYNMATDPDSNDSTTLPPAPVLTASIEGAPKGAMFMLVANDSYFSEPFSSSKNKIVFARADKNLNIDTPLFIDLVKLKLVAVKPKATVDAKGIITSRDVLPEGLKVLILIDGKPLFSKSVLQRPRDLSNLSEALLNPKDLLKLRFASECRMSQADYNKIQSQILSGSEAGR